MDSVVLVSVGGLGHVFYLMKIIKWFNTYIFFSFSVFESKHTFFCLFLGIGYGDDVLGPKPATFCGHISYQRVQRRKTIVIMNALWISGHVV